MDREQRKLRRKAVLGDHDAYIALCRLKDRQGIQSEVTKFDDMHSHGYTKTPYETIWIEAPEEQAVEIFKLRLGVSPYEGACSCCGAAFSITGYSDMWDATGYERGCEFDENKDRYIESQRKKYFVTPYISMEDFLSSPDPEHLYISRYDFTPEEAMIELGNRTNPLPLSIPPKRRKAQRCLVCNSTTREGKLYCPEHIDKSQYVIDLRRRIKQKEDELLRVAKVGVTAIRPDSETVLDIIAQLKEHGHQSVEKLSVLVDLDKDLTRIYADYLVSRGFAEWIDYNRRSRHLMLIHGTPYVAAERDVTAESLANLYGLVPRTIKKWARSAGAPHTNTKDGPIFNIDEFKIWHDGYKARISRKRSKASYEKHQRLLTEVGKAGRFRNLTRAEVAKELGISQRAIDDTVKRGAPHDLEQVGNVPLRFFNAKELAKWREEDDKRAKAQHRQSLRKGIQRRKPSGYVTALELCKAMGWPPSRARLVRRYASSKGAPHKKVGRSTYFNVEDFKDWFEEFQSKTEGHLAEFVKAGPRGVRKKIERLKEQGSYRNLTRFELAEELGSSVGSVDRWIRIGCPHDVAGSAGGKAAKLRLFNADEVREWRKEMQEKGAATRGGGYSDEIWSQVVDFMNLGHSRKEAAKKFGMSAGGIRNYMRRKGIEVEEIKSKRALTRDEVAGLLGVAPHTVWTWTTQGAPFEKRGHVPGAKEQLFFNLDELKAWRTEQQSTERARRGKAMSKALRHGYDEPFWKELAQDYLDGVSIKLLRKKYKVGEKRMRRYFKENDISRKDGRFKPSRPRRRSNPDEIGGFNLAPLGGEQANLVKLNIIKQTIMEIAENTPEGSLVPSCPAVGAIPAGQPLKARASFDLMLSGRYPLIRVREGQEWQIKPGVIRRMSELMVRSSPDREGGVGDANAWYNLLAACGSGAELHVMDKNGERYKVIDVEVDYGQEDDGPASGELIVQHLGRRSRGGKRARLDIQDVYGQILPFVSYKDLGRRSMRRFK